MPTFSITALKADGSSTSDPKEGVKFYVICDGKVIKGPYDDFETAKAILKQEKNDWLAKNQIKKKKDNNDKHGRP